MPNNALSEARVKALLPCAQGKFVLNVISLAALNQGSAVVGVLGGLGTGFCP